jgi:hypothetical protein
MFEMDLTREKMDQLMAEMQLLSLGNVIPLNITIDLPQFMEELKTFENQWIDYLPRSDRQNNRKGLSLFGLPGDTLNDGLSLPEASKRKGRRLSEMEFNSPTQVFEHCKSLHSLFSYFEPVGRSFIVKSDAGGWFYPHRDHPGLFRDSMRIIVFCKNSKAGQYDWILDDKKLDIEEGRAYYVNTRLVHRTISYVNDSLHLIMNVAPTWHNSQQVLKALQFTHG